MYKLYLVYTQDQQFILESTSKRGAYLRLVDGRVILEVPTAKTWKKGASYPFKKGIQVSFRAKNPDFLSKNPDFLFKNPDFLLKNVHFMVNTVAEAREPLSKVCRRCG